MMQFSSFNSSYEGIRVDVLKSLLQKAIRRGLQDEALAAGLRLFAFCYKNGYDEQEGGKWTGRSVFSNLLNRLIVIAGEDIGVGALASLPLIDCYVQKFRLDDSLSNFSERIDEFITLICFMCAQKKSRLVSWSRTMFSREAFMYEEIKGLREWEEEVERIKDPVQRVIYILKQENRPKIFYYLSIRYVVELSRSPLKEKIERGYPRKRKILSPIVYKLWNIYLRQNDELIELLYKWHLQENEKEIYVILATLIYFADVNKKCTFLPEDVPSRDFFEKAMKKLEVPDWAVDKHTNQGRKLGKDGKTFALEGATINDPWPCLPLLEKLYCKSKGIEIKKEEGEFFIDKKKLEEIYASPRGQLRTFKNKQAVFLCKDYAYKGPWKDTEEKRNKFKFLQERRENFEKLGTKVLRYEFGSDYLGDLWIRSKIVTTRDSELWQWEEVEGNIEENKVKIINKESMGLKELHKESTEKIAEVLFGKQFMFLSYIDAALLGVGDCHLRNNLLDEEGNSHIIDWDDNTGRKEIKDWDDVFSKSSKKLKEIVKLGKEVYKREDEVREYVLGLRRREDISYDKKYMEMLEQMIN